MKKLRLFIYFFISFISISCEIDEIECKAFDKTNSILNFTMFQDKKEFYEFTNNQNDTIKLSYFERSYSEKYIERCGGFADPNCNCFSGFEELYKVNDSIFFRTQISISTLEDESEFIDLDYSVNSSRYSENQIVNNSETITSRLNQITQENLTINNQQFQDVIYVELNKHLNDKSLITHLILKENEGLIAFLNDGKLYLKK